MPVDAAFAPMLASIAQMAAPPPGADPVASARAATDALFVHPTAPHVATEDRTIPGPAGAIAVRVYRPRDAVAALPVLVYFHGGGFIAGSLASHDGTVRELTAGAGCVTISVDYRLAPEHRFPAAVEDCSAALEWAAKHAADIGGDGDHIAIGGDSAGGNLCAVVALMNRDRGGPTPCLQLLVYPVTDPACNTPSMAANATLYMLTAASMRWMWASYLGETGDPDNPYAAPARAESLAALPPALVITAEFDPLRDEGEAYARRLAAHGVPVTISRYGGQIHGFFSMYALAPQARVATAQAVRALRRAFAR
jgi:acetyl esterase